MSLQKKIDFALILSVENANPNGDPLNGNRPRVNYDGYGEISDVCLKRKIRDRLQEAKQSIFVQSDERKTDGYVSLRARAEAVLGKDKLNSKKTKPEETIKEACTKWFDVRAFGQLFAFKSEGKDGVSIPIRGPVTIQSAFSVDPVNITSIQITKSVSSETTDTGKKASDTMGMKHRIDKGIYVSFGAISPQLAGRTGFSDADAAIIKSILPRLFEGDASSARPEGSMRVLKVLWWEHNCASGQYSSAKVHKSIKVEPDGEIKYLEKLEGLELEIIDGF